MTVLADQADLGDLTAAEFTAIRTEEEAERGDEEAGLSETEDWVVSFPLL